MASATDLVSNTGNAGLSLGFNNAIPVITDPEKSGFNFLQETANKMMMQNHANNVMMFRQKVQDRDDLYKALNEGQVSVGEIDPKDRPYFEKAKKEQEKAFYDMAQNGGVTNKEAYRKYIQATTALKETVTHVQARKVGIDQYKADIAKEPIQAKKEQISKQFQKQYDKDSGAMIDPYQTSLDFDADKLLGVGKANVLVGSGVPQTVTTQSVRTKVTPGKPTTTTTYQKTAPITAKGKAAQPITTVQGVPEVQTNVVYKNGLPYSVTKQYVDFNKIKQNYNDSFLEKTGEGTELQNQFYDKFTDPNIISHEEIKPTYDYMVKKAEEYNRSRGFTPLEDGSMSAEDLRNGAADVKKLIAAFNVPPDPQTGKRNVNMSKPELASYFALAHMDNFGTQTETLLKDEAALQFQNKKLSEEMKLKYKQLEGQNALRYAQIRNINKSLEGKSDEEQQQVFNKEWAANGATALNLAVLGNQLKSFIPGGAVPKGAIPYQNSRAVYTKDLKGNPTILKPIGSKNVYDVVDAEGKPTAKSKVIGYEGGYYRTDFYNKATGGAIGIENIEQAFTKAKKQNPSLTEQDFLINLGNAGVTYRAIGDNNTSSNIDDNGDNLRIINNKNKSKGEQDPIFSDTELFNQETE